MPRNRNDLIHLIHDHALPLSDTTDLDQPLGEQVDRLVEMIGDARFVLLGEASHGTAEFYAIRRQLTTALIREKGFAGAIVEADWPDAYRVNRYARGTGEDPDPDTALGGFKRFPQWMWRNTIVTELVEDLRQLNEEGHPCGFYGMDLYSLHASAEAVLRYLEKIDPEAAARARDRYGCFAGYVDPTDYGMAASYNLDESCEKAVIEQLTEMVRQAGEYVRRDGRLLPDEHFVARQNARLVANAERYYRSMFSSRDISWNLRDTHMADTVEALADFLDDGNSKLILWAHNSHLGDARATEMGRGGEINVGQLLRERQPGKTFTLGFTTHTGSVTAAHNWGDPAKHMRVNESMTGSVERLFHDAGEGGDFVLDLREPDVADALREPMLQRMIGVIYRPRTERMSHYVHANLSDQFDAICHVDRSHALRPLEPSADWVPDEAETFPSGL